MECFNNIIYNCIIYLLYVGITACFTSCGKVGIVISKDDGTP